MVGEENSRETKATITVEHPTITTIAQIHRPSREAETEEDYPRFQDLEALLEMGFATKVAVEALRRTKNVNDATAMLLEKNTDDRAGKSQIDLALERTFQGLVKKESDVGKQ